MRFGACIAAALMLSAYCRPAYADEPTVRVHVDTRGAWLERASELDTWVRVCQAPCDLDLPTKGRYRLGNIDFVFPEGQRAVTLEIVDSAAATNTWGIVVAAVGGGAISTGLLLALGAQLSRDGPSTGDGSDVRTMTIGGLTTAGIGAGLLVTGVVLATRVGEPRIEISSSRLPLEASSQPIANPVPSRVSILYVSRQPIPAGYRVVDDGNAAVWITGLSTFVVAYVFSLSMASAGCSCTSLAVPAAGPFIQVASHPFHSPLDGVVVGLGAAQDVGLGLVVVGRLIHGTRYLQRADAASPNPALVPRVGVGPGTVSLSWRF